MPLNYEESATFNTPSNGGSRSNIITRNANEIEIENQYEAGPPAAVHHIGTLEQVLTYVRLLIEAARAAINHQAFQARAGFDTPASNGSSATITVVANTVQIDNQYGNIFPDVITHVASVDQTLNYASLLTESTRSALLP